VSGPAAPLIRPGTPDDLAAVVELERRCFDDPWPAWSLAAELESDSRRRTYMAELAGDLVGYLMAWHVADELHIVNVAVDPAARRGGVATALLAYVLGRFAAEEGRLATLEVRRGNAGAIAFYRRHGFVQTGVRRGYYQDTGEDALIMSLERDTGDGEG
jgi:ribosomal-protein-alanine N-acetyltransferase